MPGKRGSNRQMRSCNIEKSAFWGDEFSLCNDKMGKREWGRMEGKVGGRFCM